MDSVVRTWIAYRQCAMVNEWFAVLLGILRLSSNRSPYILILDQKVRDRANKVYAFKIKQDFAETFHLKMKCTSYTNEVREKAPSFQNVSPFL